MLRCALKCWAFGESFKSNVKLTSLQVFYISRYHCLKLSKYVFFSFKLYLRFSLKLNDRWRNSDKSFIVREDTNLSHPVKKDGFVLIRLKLLPKSNGNERKRKRPYSFLIHLIISANSEMPGYFSHFVRMTIWTRGNFIENTSLQSTVYTYRKIFTYNHLFIFKNSKTFLEINNITIPING